MQDLQEIDIGAIRNIAGYILSGVATGLVGIGGVSLLIRAEWITTNISKITNLGNMIITLGIIHCLSVIFYWIPYTSNLGFFLMCSLTGAMIATELIAGNSPIPGLSIATVLYVGTWLRKPDLFSLGF